MLSQAGQVLVQQVDNMMVGYVGIDELAASAFANSVFVLGLVFAMGFTFGLTPLVGHAFAQNDRKEAASLLKCSFLTNSIIVIILSVLLWGISYTFHLMGQPEHIVEMAVSYYRILVVSLIPFIMFFTMKQFAEGMADTKHAMVITIVANLINIFFNYLLIFGNFGMPQLGLDGAGYGTLISRISMPLLFIFFFMRKEKFRSFIPLLKTVKASKARVIRLLSVGFPIATQILLEVTAFGLSGIMMGWLGVVPLAAHNIALGLATVSFMIVTGIGSATTIRVSHQYSVKDFAALQMAAKASIHLVLVFMTFAAIMFALFRNLLPMLYTQDSEVIALAAQLLVFVAVFQIFDGLQVTLLSILRGLADVRNAMIYALIAYIIVNLPVSYFFAFELGWGAGGIWLGFVVGLGLAAALFYSRIHKLFNKFDRNYSTSKSK